MKAFFQNCSACSALPFVYRIPFLLALNNLRKVLCGILSMKGITSSTFPCYLARHAHGWLRLPCFIASARTVQHLQAQTPVQHSEHPWKVTQGSVHGHEHKVWFTNKQTNKLKTYKNITEAAEQTWSCFQSLFYISNKALFERKVKDGFFLSSFYYTLFTFFLMYGFYENCTPSSN